MSHEQSESIGKLAAAMSLAQPKISAASKSSDNPFFKSKYADLPTCMEVLREPLAEHGLSIIHTLGHRNGDAENKYGSVEVYTTLAHTSGEWVRGCCVVPLKKAGPQEIGSCITYARRYSLAIVGLVQVDDDAEHSEQLFRDAEKAKPKPPAGLVPAKPAGTQKLTLSSQIVVETQRQLGQCTDGTELSDIFTAAPYEVKKLLTPFKNIMREKLGV